MLKSALEVLVDLECKKLTCVDVDGISIGKNIPLSRKT